MTQTFLSGAKIRQDFIDFFVNHGHTYVPSASLVPGGDQTLLFTNAGMVQFKDIFLGIDKRPYVRATNSQKCMRVTGKHNDLEDVGRDVTHHTFFEMLGNWSFGDYYKAEAIAWAWQLLCDVWGLPKDKLWVTCFKDEKDEIPTDEEAAQEWRKQPGIVPSHILFFGRKDNFWEMADTGPCGPCSEIHIDRGPSYCNMQDVPGHKCAVNGDCARFTELWNLVFIQYNRLSPTHLEPLPEKHVDTGMGLDRIVSVLQGVGSNYQTDLFAPLVKEIQELSGQNDIELEENIVSYRVIADHTRAATFLIADGVVPGNLGRNYICRMIIRRAARFGGKIGLNQPFLAKIAQKVIDNYGEFYHELRRNQETILTNLTREEERFQRTVESGLAKLENLLTKLQTDGENILPGDQAFDLYATYGLPLEITRDIAQEQDLAVDEAGFHQALEQHRIASGAGEAFGPLGGEDVDVYRHILKELQEQGSLDADGVHYDPYHLVEIERPVLSLIKDKESINQANPGDTIEIILPETNFYVESGGQVSDTGKIISHSVGWEVNVSGMRKPAAGVIVHVGQVVEGNPRVGDMAVAQVDEQRRKDIMRNHTATHLLHAELRAVLGEHARQAGSLVAPDRLRFDFTHPQPLTLEQIEAIEAGVNRAILNNYKLNIVYKPLEQALDEGAIALFGEKYGATVRNITIGDTFSNELCGGTHVDETADIGVFLIVNEGSTAAGIRRIEAVTGWRAYELIQKRFQVIKNISQLLGVSPEEIPHKAAEILETVNTARKEISGLRRQLANQEFGQHLVSVQMIKGVPVLAASLPGADVDTLREMTDRFRQKYPSGVAVLATINKEDHPVIIAAVTEDLTQRGLHAGNLVKHIAQLVGGSGGGRPTLAQAGGKDASQLEQALLKAKQWVDEHLK